ncbi:MAG TPA: thioredoxin domain-containing protein, partial [Longimicrobiaceae bacterium]|nr:thioredoxin domain-containing protein [Longimicrobiaceae bacterium]
DAPVTIVELSDFECPYCSRFHEETFPALRRLYGDRVQWIFVNRYFPEHPSAERAAIAGECAHRQGRFWEYADLLFAGQERLGDGVIEDAAREIGLDMATFEACVNNRETAAEVAADQAEGDRLGVDGTPTFYVNGHMVLGAQPVSVFNQIIAPYFSR